jgi:hypothetical protein
MRRAWWDRVPGVVLPLTVAAGSAGRWGRSGLWHTCPGRGKRVNCATIRPARRLTMERVTASVCPCSSRPSQDITGVTPGGGALQLLRLIRVLRLIRGTGMHRINHEARIHHANVAKAADVRVAAPRLGVVAPWPREQGPVAHTPRRFGQISIYPERSAPPDVPASWPAPAPSCTRLRDCGLRPGMTAYQDHPTRQPHEPKHSLGSAMSLGSVMTGDGGERFSLAPTARRLSVVSMECRRERIHR